MRDEVVLPTVKHISRKDFLERHWRYKPGEHVTFIAPTQNGKTTMIFDLLAHTHFPEGVNPPIVLVIKPKDPLVAKKIKAMKYRKVQTWPAIKSPWNPNPKGYALWPKHTFDPDVDDAMHKRIMQTALRHTYKKGNTTIVADETYGLIEDLGLSKDITRIHTRGAAMGTGLWVATQKPTHIGRWAYGQAEHLFVGFDPDQQSRERFGEIGGVDPKLVQREAAKLKKFEWLYFRRSDRVLCVIEAE
jgi:hypothetical protein